MTITNLINLNDAKKLKSIVKHRPFPRFATLTQRAKALERGLLFDKKSHTRQLHVAAIYVKL